MPVTPSTRSRAVMPASCDNPRINAVQRLTLAIVGAAVALLVPVAGASATIGCSGVQHVYSANDLVDLSQCASFPSSLTVTLSSHIDLSTETSPNAFRPIGSASAPFLGTFDGNGYSISGLSLGASATDDRGLFGVVGSAAAGGDIRNLTLVSPSVAGQDRVGALVGRFDGGVISNVSVLDGQVTARNTVGGLIGQVRLSRTVQVSDVDVKGAWTGVIEVGGLVGTVLGMTTPSTQFDATRVAIAGSVTGDEDLGGVLGELRVNQLSTTTNVTDVVSTVSVTGDGTGYIGGLIGRVTVASSAQALALTRVAAIGELQGGAALATGGLVGRLNDPSLYLTVSGAASSVFWNTDEVSCVYCGGNELDAHATGRTAAQLATLATYTEAASPWSMVSAAQAEASSATWTRCPTANLGYPFRRTSTWRADCAAPGAPTALVSVPVSSAVSLAFAAGSAGDAPITSYELSINGGTWAYAGTASPITIPGFVNGVAVGVRVRGVSYVGFGTPSATITVVPGGPCTGDNGSVLQGAGTTASPYLVSSADNLKAVGTGTCGLGEAYLQTADITMPAAVPASGVESNFTPIGRSAPHFSGVYDGGGYGVAGLVFVDARDPGVGGYAGNDLGLFGTAIDGATVRRVHVRAARLEGGDDVGALIGLVETGGGAGVLVEDATATGSVSARANAGGLIGKVAVTITGSDVDVSGVRADVDVVGTSPLFSGSSDSLGGLIGLVQVDDAAQFDLSDGQASGDVSVARVNGAGLGGLIGAVRLEQRVAGAGTTTPVTLSDVVARGAVSAPSGAIVGGLLGWVASEASQRALRVERAAATGSVSGRDFVGGLIGTAERSPIYRSAPLVSSAGLVEVIDAYATGALAETDASGSAAFGGLIGKLGSTFSAGAGGRLMLEQAYATGAVPAGGKGLVGVLDYPNVSATTYFWNVETTGRSDSGMTIDFGGSTTAQLQDLATFTSAPANWSIVRRWQAPTPSAVWGMCAPVNDGFPFLLMEFATSPCPVAAAPAATAPAASVVSGSTTRATVRLRAPQVLSGGRIQVSAQVSGPGRVVVTGRLAQGARAAASVCSAARAVRQAGTYPLVCTLNRASRVASTQRALTVVLTVVFTPTGGTATRSTTTVKVPKSARAAGRDGALRSPTATS